MSKNKENYGQSFDDRAIHLNNNIYHSNKGNLRLHILQRDLSEYIVKSDKKLSVLDAGCGAGIMTQWALEQGHSVTACDTSLIMTNEVQQRLGSNPHLTVLHSTIQELPHIDDDQKYDVIFCHAVLEWVENKTAIIDSLLSLLKPNGIISLMFYNAWAREMAQLVYGNFDYIDKGYAVKKKVKLTPHYPAFPDKVEKQLNDKGIFVQSRSGIRIFYDIMRHQDRQEQQLDDIIRHELRISQQYPYWQMGRYIHFIGIKKEKAQ